MSDDTDSPSGMLHRDGEVTAGAHGGAYLMHVNGRDEVALGRDVRIAWEGDAFTLTSPHTAARVRGDRNSRIYHGASGQNIAQVELLRHLDGLPRGARVSLHDWA